MIKSMTGYGRGQATAGGMILIAEIRSVNHRYADITVKAPRLLLPFEAEIRKQVGERLKRGKIDVFISHEFTEDASLVPTLNRPLAAAYVELFREMAAAFGLEETIPLSLLAGQRDVVTLREAALDEAAMRSCLAEALNQALTAVEAMRRTEGEATRQDMGERLAAAERLLEQVETRAPLVPAEWQAKLAERLSRLQQEIEVDPQRVAQEVAVYADRCDISEEVARFRSHLEQFRALSETAEPVGRKMDFLVQELNRETNTMGSKANDAELTRLVVAIKAELEKIREQVQNIE